jgi:hypothetical protein
MSDTNASKDNTLNAWSLRVKYRHGTLDRGLASSGFEVRSGHSFGAPSEERVSAKCLPAEIVERTGAARAVNNQSGERVQNFAGLV